MTDGPTGLKQDNAQILLKIVLKKTIRIAQPDKQVFDNNGPQLLLAYDGNIDVVGKLIGKTKELFVHVDKAAEKI